MKNESWIEKKLNLDNTFKALIRYLYMRRDLMEMNLKDYLAKMILSLVILVFILGLFLLILLFISLAGALYLNELLHSKFAGFMLMAFLFFLIGCLVFLMRKKLITNVVYKLIFEIDMDEPTDTDE